MAMSETDYERDLKETKYLVAKLKTIDALTEREKSLIRVALVDYFIGKIETGEDEDVPADEQPGQDSE